MIAKVAKAEGRQLAYLFYKRPTDQELEVMRTVIRDAVGDDFPVIVNYLFK